MTHETTMTPKARRARNMEMMMPGRARISAFSLIFSYCRATRCCLSTGGQV